MQIKIFNIPITDTGELMAEMNGFLVSKKVLEIEQQFYQNEKGAFWSFCVRFIQGTSFAHSNQTIKFKPDYKEILNEQEFAKFLKLRECRKTVASEDAVPAYAVFTDEELSGIAKLNDLTASKLIQVQGIGEKKLEKYGKKIIELYRQKETDEKRK